jgi:predicted RNA-binding Zn-ribbon protein involved in translation (DUF1610 family)
MGEVGCAGCGYPLGGLSPDAKCPECGTLVRRSLEGRRLADASPEYRRTLGLGMTVVLVGCGLRVAAAVFRMSAFAGAGPIATGVETLASAGAGIADLTVMAGLLVITARDPGLGRVDEADVARRRARILAGLYGALVLAEVAAMVIRPSIVIPRGGGPMLLPIGLGVAGLIGTIVLATVKLLMVILTCEYLQHIAIRIPDRKLIDGSLRAIWLLPLVHLGGYACCGLGPIAASVLLGVLIGQFLFHRSGLFSTGGARETG